MMITNAAAKEIIIVMFTLISYEIVNDLKKQYVH